MSLMFSILIKAFAITIIIYLSVSGISWWFVKTVSNDPGEFTFLDALKQLKSPLVFGGTVLLYLAMIICCV